MNQTVCGDDRQTLRFNTLYDGENYLVFIKPYLPIDYGEDSFTIDAYYFASNALYFEVKEQLFCLRQEGLPAEICRVPLKQLLARCGLADTGMNTLCMTEEFGSRFVIGAIKTPGESERFAAREVCARCGRCADACPTGAITPDGFIRARCLRELMETKNYDDETSRIAGTRLLGCDICQRVCPINRGSRKPTERENLVASPKTLITLSRQGELPRLAPYIGANYARRGKLEYLLVNAAGNSGDRAFLDYLLDLRANTENEKINLERAVKKLCAI